MTETMRSWLARKTARRPRPLDVLFELTEVCNLRCRHCYLPAYEERGLSTEEAKGILDQLAQAGTLFLTFTGGEPLTRPDFVELAAYARRKGLALRIFTNGTLLTPPLADQIRDLHPLGVEMSLYGATAPVHDAATRVPGSFERTVRGVRLLRERGVPVRLKALLMRHNIHQAKEMRALAESLDSVHFWDVYITARRDGSLGPWAERATDEQLVTFFADQAQVLGERVVNEWLGQESLIKSPPTRDERICSPGRMGCRIAADGRVYPCAECFISPSHLGGGIILKAFGLQKHGSTVSQAAQWLQESLPISSAMAFCLQMTASAKVNLWTWSTRVSLSV